MNRATADSIQDGDAVPKFTAKIDTLYPEQYGKRSALIKFVDTSTYLVNLESPESQAKVAEGQTYNFQGCTKASGISKKTGKPWASIKVTLQSRMDLAGAMSSSGGGGGGSSKHGSPENGGKVLSADQMATAFASIIVKTRNALVKLEVDEKEAMQIASSAPEWVSLWWFGAKYPQPKKVPTVDLAAKKLVSTASAVYDDAVEYVMQLLGVDKSAKINIEQYNKAINVDDYKAFVAKAEEDDFEPPGNAFDDEDDDDIPF